MKATVTGSLMRSSITQRHFGSLASHLRSVAFLEGLSYVALLFVAVPLKYLGDLPLAVRCASWDRSTGRFSPGSACS